MTRRFVTVFSGVMTVIFLLRSMGEWYMVAVGHQDGDSRRAVLTVGLVVLYLAVALLSHFDHSMQVVLTVIGLIILTTCGFDYITGDVASAVVDLVLAALLLLACFLRRQMGMDEDEL